MHDLRKQALGLESKKTVSKKAKSKQSSRASPAAGSRPTSRAGSRAGSDDESEGNLSDGTNYSNNTLDDLAEIEPDLTENWKEELGDLINDIIDRKRSNVQGRSAAFARYTRLLQYRYAEDEVDKRTEELLPAVMKSVKLDGDEKEACLALKAIAATMITCPDAASAAIFKALKKVYTDSESHRLKVEAIHTLAGGMVFGEAGDDDVLETMDELLEIIESDGSSIDAADSEPVVTACLEAWGFLATTIDDLSSLSETAMEAFTEQLNSTSASVLIASGQNIALLYEKSYTDREEDDSPASEDEDSEGFPIDNSLVKRYNVYSGENQLKHSLIQISKAMSRRTSKNDRKSLHSTFRDILNSVEHPWRGPGFQMAIDQNTGRRYGAGRLGVRLGGRGKMIIDRWWKLLRLQELRRCLGGGFVEHWEKNPVVSESLPVSVVRQEKTD